MSPLSFRLKSGLFPHLFLTVLIEQQHHIPNEKEKAQTRYQNPFYDEEPFHMTHDTTLHCHQKNGIPAEQYNTAEEAISPQESCVTASEGTFPAAESCINASDGEALPEKAPPSKEDQSKRESAYPVSMWKAPQVELTTKGLDESEQHLWKS